MQFFETIWWFLVLIGVMIMVHELGHYWAARFFDVKVDAFSFGFGPRLFGFKKGETDFRVSAILFGGYVKMSGEQPGDEAAADPRSFLSKPRWQRLIIAFAGPFMNIILAVGILTGVYMVKFPKTSDTLPSGLVGLVLPDSPAAQAGIREGDRIVEIDGTQSPTWEDITVKEYSSPDRALKVVVSRAGKEFETHVTPKLDKRSFVGLAGWGEQTEVMLEDIQPGMDAERKGLRRGDVLVSVNGNPVRSKYRLTEMIKASQGHPVEIAFLRDGKPQTVSVQPVMRDFQGQQRYMIGVGLQDKVDYVALPFPEALTESVRQNKKFALLIFDLLDGIVKRRMSPKTLEGPIGIARVSGVAAKEGPIEYFKLMTMVSMNLAIFNLLPIPILDGGVILLLLIEMLYRKDLSLQFKETVIKFGFVFLMMVVAFVIYNDISKWVLSRG